MSNLAHLDDLLDDCCPKSNIANLTFKSNIQNRVCLSCGAHWYGGVRYTRKEWDALMEGAQ